MKNDWLERLYDQGMDWVFSHKKLSLLMTASTLPLCVFFFYYLEKERMPEIEQALNIPADYQYTEVNG